MKHVLSALFLLSLLAACGRQNPELSYDKELYVRSRVVQLYGNDHACSGIQVHSPKGHDYILTAAHCDVLAENGSIQAQAADGRLIPRRVLEDSPVTDLMLLEGMPDLKGIEVAESVSHLERITALTHGLALPTHKAEGEFMADIRIQVEISMVSSEEEKAQCSAKPKNKVRMSLFGDVCMMDVVETVSTVHIDPGSSGGPAVNSDGQLVGIASAGSAVLSCWVTLKDIHEFMKPY